MLDDIGRDDREAPRKVPGDRRARDGGRDFVILDRREVHRGPDQTQRKDGDAAETESRKPGQGDEAEEPADKNEAEAKPAAAQKKAEQPEEEDPKTAARRKRKRWIIAGIAGAILLVAAIAFGIYWFSTLRWLESTDDAYTQADNTIIGPKVAGYIAEVLVTDNEAVRAGQPVARIDARDYRAAFDQAQADIVGAEADIRNLDAQIDLQRSTIDQAQADIVSAQAAVTFAEQENARYQALVKTGSGTVQRAQQALSDLQAKMATLQHNRATLSGAQKQVAVLQTQKSKSQAVLQHDRAVLEQARLNLGYTELVSPIDGAVGDRAVRLGQYVQPGTQLMTIVPMRNQIYVVANFKETQIERMFRGERVDLSIDTYPDVTLHGAVDSLAPGSGAQFALLPPENATGNFTKIVQRVPVKILLDDKDNPVLDRLRPGLSVVATVDTRTAPDGNRETLIRR